MPEYRHQNVIIRSLNGNAREAILFAHGGYTPSRYRLFSGSGHCTTPLETRIGFNALHNKGGIFTRGLHLLSGTGHSVADDIHGGSRIINYSLSYDNKAEEVEPNERYDIIVISSNGKAHMSDIFDAMRQHNRHYTYLYSVACRFNKLTYRPHQS
jgi:hypothetical protein